MNSVFLFTWQRQETKRWSRNSLRLRRRSLIKRENLQIIQIKVPFIFTVDVQSARLAVAPEEKWNSSIFRERQSHAQARANRLSSLMKMSLNEDLTERCVSSEAWAGPHRVIQYDNLLAQRRFSFTKSAPIAPHSAATRSLSQYHHCPLTLVKDDVSHLN